MNIIQTIDAEQIAKLTEGKPVPTFAPGDTLRVSVKVVEGERSRIQAFEGVCIARSNRGINSSFTVRKISYGEGVERVSFSSTRQPSPKSTSCAAVTSAAPSCITSAAAAVNPPVSPRRPVRSTPRLLSNVRQGGFAPLDPH